MSEGDCREVAVVSIVVSWNVKEYLRGALEDLRNQRTSLCHRIVVVDNASEDGSPEMVRELFPEVELMRNSINKGFSAAVNQAIKSHLEAKYFLLVNPDLRCSSETLRSMVEIVEKIDRAGIVGSRIFDSSGTECTITRYPRVVRGLSVELRTFILKREGRRSKESRHLVGKFSHKRTQRSHNFLELFLCVLCDPCGYFILEMGSSKVVLEVECVEGCCMLIRGEVVREIGMFDEGFWAYFEETDYCLRARKGGWKVVCSGDLKVTHNHSRSFLQRPFFRRRVWNSSFDRFLRKHHPVRRRVFGILVRLVWSAEFIVRWPVAMVRGVEGARAVVAEFTVLMRRRKSDDDAEKDGGPRGPGLGLDDNGVS